MNDVIRTDTGHLCVKGSWLLVSEVAHAACAAVKSAGSGNPAFDAPPFCYTGCPYPDAILSLGCKEVEGPKSFRIESVPHDGKKPWRSRNPIWPQVFNIAQDLYEQ